MVNLYLLTYTTVSRLALLTRLRWGSIAWPGWAALSMWHGFLAPGLYHAVWHNVTEGADYRHRLSWFTKVVKSQFCIVQRWPGQDILRSDFGRSYLVTPISSLGLEEPIEQTYLKRCPGTPLHINPLTIGRLQIERPSRSQTKLSISAIALSSFTDFEEGRWLFYFQDNLISLPCHRDLRGTLLPIPAVPLISRPYPNLTE